MHPILSVLLLALVSGCAESLDDPNVQGELSRLDRPGSTSTCVDASEGLQEALACVIDAMPAEGSMVQGSIDSSTGRAYEEEMGRMLAGGCNEGVAPGVLGADLRARRLSAEDSDDDYCLLFGDRDLDADGKDDLGWGTLVTRIGPANDLHLQVPHTGSDLDTWEEGAGIFQATHARSLFIAGTHRDADAEQSGCQSDATISDPSHNRANTLSYSTELLANEETGLVLQLHGMAADTCPTLSVFFSDGAEGRPGVASPIWDLASGLRNVRPDWAVGATGGSEECSLGATMNIQGRVMNGVPLEEACSDEAMQSSNRFIHIEQDPDQRDSAIWGAALRSSNLLDEAR